MQPGNLRNFIKLDIHDENRLCETATKHTASTSCKVETVNARVAMTCGAALAATDYL